MTSGMFTTDTVTIVTAATGHRDLSKCLGSVQRQTYPHVHHCVVVDGAEHAGKVHDAIAKRSESKRPLDAFCLPQPTGKQKWNGHRIYAAMSYLVNTEFISFLDEDNWLEPDHVESLISAIRSTNSQWAFSLRNIVDGEGNFVTRDECESLGNLHHVFFNKDHFHIDANCYMLKREIAVQLSQAWYRPTRPPAGQLEPDTLLCRLLLQNCPQVCSNRRHTVNYAIGNRSDSVRAEFFLRGNEAMHQAYPTGLPWDRAEQTTSGKGAS
jgi:hypothetical protein